eukprot:9102-Heterococcus_DN1.PRE.1
MSDTHTVHSCDGTSCDIESTATQAVHYYDSLACHNRKLLSTALQVQSLMYSGRCVYAHMLTISEPTSV